MIEKPPNERIKKAILICIKNWLHCLTLNISSYTHKVHEECTSNYAFMWKTDVWNILISAVWMSDTSQKANKQSKAKKKLCPNLKIIECTSINFIIWLIPIPNDFKSVFHFVFKFWLIDFFFRFHHFQTTLPLLHPCTREYSSVHTQQPAKPVREVELDPYILLDDDIKYVTQDIRDVSIEPNRKKIFPPENMNVSSVELMCVALHKWYEWSVKECF